MVRFDQQSGGGGLIFMCKIKRSKNKFPLFWKTFYFMDFPFNFRWKTLDGNKIHFVSSRCTILFHDAAEQNLQNIKN